MVKVTLHLSLLFFMFVVKLVTTQYQFINPIHFPYSPTGNPYIGMFVAIALPIDITGPADLFFTANFESSYGLPENQTNLSYPPIISSTRGFLYKILELKLNEYGFKGKYCLQRAVCEAAEYTTLNSGVLGDMFHILLTPSSSLKEDKLDEYVESESLGRNGHCKKYKKQCPLSILNFISVVKKI